MSAGADLVAWVEAVKGEVLAPRAIEIIPLQPRPPLLVVALPNGGFRQGSDDDLRAFLAELRSPVIEPATSQHREKRGASGGNRQRHDQP